VPGPGDYDDGEIGGMIWLGKPKYLEKMCPSAYSFYNVLKINVWWGLCPFSLPSVELLDEFQ
jgi:hypothetical protein